MDPQLSLKALHACPELYKEEADSIKTNEVQEDKCESTLPNLLTSRTMVGAWPRYSKCTSLHLNHLSKRFDALGKLS